MTALIHVLTALAVIAAAGALGHLMAKRDQHRR